MMRAVLPFLLLLGVPAGAQISLDDATAAVDARVGELSTFEDLLADEDPRRALAAMQVMIEKGDADQRRMALRSGLYSSDLAIRSTVLRAILNGSPALNLHVTPVGEEVARGYPGTIQYFRGTMEADNKATIAIKVGDWNEDQKCWAWQGSNDCLVRLNADVVGLFLQSWGQLVLDNEGNLRGPMTLGETPVQVVIPLAE